MNTNVAADLDEVARTHVRPRPQTGASGTRRGWRVREFEDGGVDHVEVRDGSGRVQLVIAHAAGVFWALHVGFPTARVSFPNWRLKLPDGAGPTVVYVSPSFSLTRFSNGDEAVWCIQPA
ncbi:hypothetical protein J7J08_06450 [Stenotrophomonas sp. ISL-67]|uniref:hypothetical protein n=1 Tax=Stenotrophomonas sp. ISL-67 TaxID=2819171 RepID=UPI001BEB39ED|nr:hypothetical protein [Stenotrophomonas sp. ISL-67]MBT2767272.1 hypothetical protein [Stenotrophomonas sp. ISL-67]